MAVEVDAFPGMPLDLKRRKRFVVQLKDEISSADMQNLDKWMEWSKACLDEIMSKTSCGSKLESLANLSPIDLVFYSMVIRIVLVQGLRLDAAEGLLVKLLDVLGQLVVGILSRKRSKYENILRNRVLKHFGKYVEKIIKVARSSSCDYTNTVLLCCISGFTDNLSEDSKSAIIDYYKKSVLNSRTEPEEYAVKCIKPFMAKHFKQTNFARFIEGIDKLILRSPEIVIKIMSTCFMAASVDLAEVFCDLSDQILKALKSTNSKVREDANTLWDTLASKSDSKQTSRAFLKLNSLLTDSTIAINIRATFLSSYKYCPAESITLLIERLSKENNPSFLVELCDVLSVILKRNADSDVQLLSAAKIMLKNKDSEVVGRYLMLLFEKKELNEDVEKYCSKVVGETAEKSAKSPSELMYAACIALERGLECNLVNSLFGSKKLVTKLGGKDLRAYASCADYLVNSHEAKFLVPSCLEAYVALVISSNNKKDFSDLLHVSRLICRVSSKSTSDSYFDMLLSELLVITTNSNSLNGGFDTKSLLESLLERENEKFLESRLLKMFKPANVGVNGCGDAVLIWPNMVVNNGLSASELMTKILPRLMEDFRNLKYEDSNKLVILNCLKCTTVVSRRLVAESVGSIVNLRLRGCNERLLQFTEEDIGIWRTPAGSLFKNVLEGETEVTDSKKGRKGDWEAELKKELEMKRLRENNLTKDEKKLVEDRLALESGIRKSVQEGINDVSLCLEIVDALGDLMEDMYFVFSRSLTAILFSLVQSDLADLAWKVYIITETVVKYSEEKLFPFATPMLFYILQTNQSYEKFIASSCGKENLIPLIVEPNTVVESMESLELPLSRSGFLFVYEFFHCLITSELKKEKPDIQLLETVVDIVGAHSKYSLSPISQYLVKDFIDIMENCHALSSRARAVVCDVMLVLGEEGENCTEETCTLLDGIQSSDAKTRYACLEALQFVDIDQSSVEKFSTRIWIACHDSDESTALLARDIWDTNGIQIGKEFNTFLLPELLSKSSIVRNSVARAIAGAVDVHPDESLKTIVSLINLYKSELAEYEDFKKRRFVEQDYIILKNRRVSVAHSFRECWTRNMTQIIEPSLSFIIDNKGGLADEDDEVWNMFLSAAKELIISFGSEKAHEFIDFFQEYLATPAPKDGSQDRVREAVVILIGTSGKFLKRGDPSIVKVIDMLLSASQTPSETIQEAVRNCLALILKVSPNLAENHVEGLLQKCLNSQSYAARRGAAYALVGILHGVGIRSLKTFNITQRLFESLKDKKIETRQGALIVFEIVFSTFKRQCEPLIVKLAPLLLDLFGDSSADVRKAASDTSKNLMANMSAYCVEQILPTVLRSLEDMRWRTKVGGVELLGTTAYMEKRLLAMYLPKIIPKLTIALSDSHKNVQKAAKESLENFTNIIECPEIRDHVPILLQALGDPNKYTEEAISALMKTAFTHYLDSSSLALVIPVVERGLQQRNSSSVKKLAAQLVGSVVSITELEDLSIHLNSLVAYLKQVLVDALPEVRSVAAKSFGLFFQVLGQDTFPGLLEEFFSSLKSYTGIDRQGFANGLAEVLAALGTETLETRLPEILNNVYAKESITQEGYSTLLVYLPATYGSKFVVFLPKVIPCLLDLLSNINDAVRQAAMKSFQVIIERFTMGQGKSVMLQLLADLENNLFHAESRVREASLILIGDVFKIISGLRDMDSKQVDNEDAKEDSTIERKNVIKYLGHDRFVTIMASLFMSRCDQIASVRQFAIIVWKMVVLNTPKMTKEVLPHVVERIVTRIGENEAAKAISINVLEELGVKMGEIVERNVIPSLLEYSKSDSLNCRRGAHMALKYLIPCVETEFEESTMKALRLGVIHGLADSDVMVKSAAASCFEVYLNVFGNTLSEDVVPELIDETLATKDSRNSVEALKQLMAVKSSIVLPFFLSRLQQNSSTEEDHLEVLSVLLQSTKDIRASDLNLVFEFVLENSHSKPLESLLKALILSVKAESLDNFVETLYNVVIYDEQKEKKTVGIRLFHLLQSSGQFNLVEHYDLWIPCLVQYSTLVLDDGYSAIDCLETILKSIKRENYAAYCGKIADALFLLDFESLHAENVDKLFSLLAPLLVQGLLVGNMDTKEKSSKFTDVLLGVANPVVIKPLALSLVGSLIRALGDKQSSETKVSITSALTTILKKIPAQTRPFLPQMQRIFIKSLTDDDAVVRNAAVNGIVCLAEFMPQADVLVKELQKAFTAEDGDKGGFVLKALYSLCIAKDKFALLHDFVRQDLFMKKLWCTESDLVQEYICKCVAKLLQGCGVSDTDFELLKECAKSEDASYRLGFCLVASEYFILGCKHQSMELLVLASLEDAKAVVVEAAIKSVGAMMCLPGEGLVLMPRITSYLSNELGDLRKAALVALQMILQKRRNDLDLSNVVPVIMACLKDRVLPVRSAAESALICAFRPEKDNGQELKRYAESLEPSERKQLLELFRKSDGQ